MWKRFTLLCAAILAFLWTQTGIAAEPASKPGPVRLTELLRLPDSGNEPPAVEFSNPRARMTFSPDGKYLCVQQPGYSRLEVYGLDQRKLLRTIQGEQLIACAGRPPELFSFRPGQEFEEPHVRRSQEEVLPAYVRRSYAESGKTRWKYVIHSPLYGAALSADQQRVLFRSTEGGVLREIAGKVEIGPPAELFGILHLATGKEETVRKVAREQDGGEEFVGCFNGPSQAVYSEHALRAVDHATGKEVWRTSIDLPPSEPDWRMGSLMRLAGPVAGHGQLFVINRIEIRKIDRTYLEYAELVSVNGKDGKPLARRVQSDAFDDMVAFAVSPNGRWLAVATSEEAAILDAKTMKKIGTAPVPPLADGGRTKTWLVQFAFSPDGSLLAGSAQGGGIVVWKIATRD